MMNPLYALDRSDLYRIFFTASLVFVKEQLLPSMIPERIEDTIEYICLMSSSVNLAVHQKKVDKDSISSDYLQEYVQLIVAVFSHKSIAQYASVILVDKLYVKAIELVNNLSEESNYEDLLFKLHKSYYHWAKTHELFFAKVEKIH